VDTVGTIAGRSKRDTVHANRADDLTRCEIVRRR